MINKETGSWEELPLHKSVPLGNGSCIKPLEEEQFYAIPDMVSTYLSYSNYLKLSK